MVSTYTPTYYTNLQDAITSICKNILPFSLKKRRVPAIAEAEQRLSKLQSDNLKWQQDSFHQILNLMGLCKEGIVSENEVSCFRIKLLETLIASPVDNEPPLILRDKLIFLQELLYAKCISEEEYHASKRPLLQRLAVQGAEIDARDVIVGAKKETTSNEKWSEIDLKDDIISTHQRISRGMNESKESSTVKKIKGAVSAFGFISAHKNEGTKSLATKIQNKADCFARNEPPGYNSIEENNGDFYEKERGSTSILMEESLPSPCVMAAKQSGDKGKKKPFKSIFHREEDEKEKVAKSGKRAWVFDGFKKWKKNDFEDEIDPNPFNEKSNGESYYGGKIVENPIGEGPDTKQIKRKLHPNGAPNDFFVDKVLGERIKKELSRIQIGFGAKNPIVHLSDDHIETISTRLPVDMADLIKCFPKSWCDEYGDIVLDVVRKEFKEHMREMGNLRGKASEKHNNFDDENSHPNLIDRPPVCSSIDNITPFSVCKG